MDPISLIFGVVQIFDIVLQYTSKNPAAAPHFAPVVGKLIGIASQAAGETPVQTTSRVSAHDAAVAQYASAPPPAGIVPNA
jgi:hypothetical protein